MKKQSSILITGGAGYIGSVLTHKLVELGYNVRVLDSLIFGKDGITDLVSSNSIDLIHADVRDERVVLKALDGIDMVMHLAGIVGDPLCRKIPEASRQINEYATKKIVNVSKKQGVKRFIFSSTCSNYGSALGLVAEDSPLKPLSLYAETKVNSESNVLNTKDSDFEPCVLRFATAFGLSPRMRFDLLVQEFIRDASIDNKIIVYGPEFLRPFVHVEDIANACIDAATKPSKFVSGEIYNVGATNQNHTKMELAEMVQEYFPSATIEVVEASKLRQNIGELPDKLPADVRNFKVSFEKIKTNLGFKTTKTVHDGISEILKEMKNGRINPAEADFSNISKRTKKIRVY